MNLNLANKRRARLQLGLIVTMLLAMVFYTMVALPAHAATSDGVSPTSGVLGSTFTINAIGFTPGERVDLWTTDPKSAVLGASYLLADTSGDIQVQIHTSDPNGLATTLGGNYTNLITNYDTDGNVLNQYLDLILFSPSLGNWALSGHGQTSNQMKYVNFSVVLGEQAATSADASPASGQLGTTFTLKGSGYEPGEKIGLWTTDPSGAALAASYVLADTSGNFQIRVQTSDPDALAQTLGANYTNLVTEYNTDGTILDQYLQVILYKPSIGSWHLSAQGNTTGTSQVFNFNTN